MKKKLIKINNNDELMNSIDNILFNLVESDIEINEELVYIREKKEYNDIDKLREGGIL